MHNTSHFDFCTRLIGYLIVISCLCLSVAQAEVLNHRTQAEVLQFLQRYQPEVMQNQQKLNFQQLVRQLLTKRVVLVGEIHDRYDHHLNQLALLKALHAQNPAIGIGVEWFQRPFQPVIDAYLAGQIDEVELLRRSEYYTRWRYDYRMLRPIMVFAKANRIPVLALNAPVEITQKVAQGGVDALSESERKQLPMLINPPEGSYLQRLRQIFMSHEHGASEKRFENFALVQRIWDEVMTANALEFLRLNPSYRLMIFTGSGHISDRMGIPNDMARTIPAEDIATVMSSSAGDMLLGKFDYVVLSKQPYTLEPIGRLGASFEQDRRGLRVSRLAPDSAAMRAGIMVNDRLTHLNNQPIQSMSELLAILAHYSTNDTVHLTLKRERVLPKGTITEPTLFTIPITLD